MRGWPLRTCVDREAGLSAHRFCFLCSVLIERLASPHSVLLKCVDREACLSAHSFCSQSCVHREACLSAHRRFVCWTRVPLLVRLIVAGIRFGLTHFRPFPANVPISNYMHSMHKRCIRRSNTFARLSMPSRFIAYKLTSVELGASCCRTVFRLSCLRQGVLFSCFDFRPNEGV